MYIHSYGIVIDQQSTGNADKLLTVYTRRYGKIKAVAVGAKRMKARLVMATEPLVETEFMFVSPSSGNGRMKVVGGKLVNSFPVFRVNIARYTIACQVAEVVEALTFEHAKNERKYQLIQRTLTLLEDAVHPERIYRAFLLRFLRLCGYGLELKHCVACSSKKSEAFALNIRKGGILCRECAKSDSQAYLLKDNSLSYMRNLGRYAGKDIDRMNVTQDIEEYVGHLCNLYLTEYTSRPLKSSAVAKELNI